MDRAHNQKGRNKAKEKRKGQECDIVLPIVNCSPACACEYVDSADKGRDEDREKCPSHAVGLRGDKILNDAWLPLG